MATYEICGTCSIYCDGAITKVRLFPAVGYISADKELAVFYSQSSPPYVAKVVKLSGNCGHKYTEQILRKNGKQVNNNLIAILKSAAGSSNKIQLFLDESLQITGCLFPAP